MATVAPAKRTVRLTLAPAPTASQLLGANSEDKKVYWDRSHYDSPEAQMRALAKSATLYIGNLSFGTRSSHLYELFGKVGPVASDGIHLGLDRYKKTPCGFSFVEYVHRRHAEEAILCLSGTKLDGRIIRVELDAGFKPGRQYGRGVSGGQVRDDRRTTIDPDRGGRVPSGARWEAPKRPTVRPYPVAQPQQQQQQQPSGSATPAASSTATSGMKRGREESEEQEQDGSASGGAQAGGGGGDGNGDDGGEVRPPPSKNPRFQEDQSDEEMG